MKRRQGYVEGSEIKRNLSLKRSRKKASLAEAEPERRIMIQEEDVAGWMVAPQKLCVSGTCGCGLACKRDIFKMRSSSINCMGPKSNDTHPKRQ